MGTDRAGVGSAALGLRWRGFPAVLAVIATALMIHLFGPALQVSTAAQSPALSPAHGHSSLELGTAHASDAAVAEAQDGQTCHSLVGVTPATTALPTVPCFVSTWRQDASAASDRSGLRPAWIGGDGADAAADPRRSPGVQRT